MSPDTKPGRTFAQVLRDGAGLLTASSSPLLDARVLLKFTTGVDDVELITRGDQPLAEESALDFDALIARRARGEPIAYIVGEKEFWSLPFKVTPDVLIPRDDSECLIEAVLARRRPEGALNILDLGAGSGCLLCALLSEFPNSFGVGLDQSENALKVARSNASALGFADRSIFVAGDWLAAVGGAFDIIIANPPYISDGERSGLPVDVAEFEPGRALFAGPDGMDDYRSILTGLAASPYILGEMGLLVFEAGHQQAGGLRKMVKETLSPAEVAVIIDLKGRQRGVVADFHLSKKRD